MRNDAPIAQYSRQLMDEMIRTYALRGPFLEVGCRPGEVAAHLRERHGWRGDSADPSLPRSAAANAAPNPGGLAVLQRPIGDLDAIYRTIVLSAVIESMADDRTLIRDVRNRLPETPGAGHLILSVPTNPAKESRWDDGPAGSYRRYTRAEVTRLMDDSGFRLMAMWDYTYPVFWAMRRLAAGAGGGRRAERAEDGWESMALTGGFEEPAAPASDRFGLWSLVGRWQRHHRTGDRGFESIAIAVTA